MSGAHVVLHGTVLRPSGFSLLNCRFFGLLRLVGIVRHYKKTAIELL